LCYLESRSCDYIKESINYSLVVTLKEDSGINYYKIYVE